MRGKPAPIIWIEEPGWGFDAVWPMLYVFGGLGFEVWFFLFFPSPWLEVVSGSLVGRGMFLVYYVQLSSSTEYSMAFSTP